MVGGCASTLEGYNSRVGRSSTFGAAAAAARAAAAPPQGKLKACPKSATACGR
ncbi:MAG: hypothetical protein ACI4GC_06375 [Acutalibacteraceae bacterium]